MAELNRGCESIASEPIGTHHVSSASNHRVKETMPMNFSKLLLHPAEIQILGLTTEGHLHKAVARLADVL
jgi:hypothetical protein